MAIRNESSNPLNAFNFLNHRKSLALGMLGAVVLLTGCKVEIREVTVSTTVNGTESPSPEASQSTTPTESSNVTPIPIETATATAIPSPSPAETVIDDRGMVFPPNTKPKPTLSPIDNGPVVIVVDRPGQLPHTGK